MTTIPASDIVSVTPSVLEAGGSALDLSGLMLTTSTRVPVGSVASFSSQPAVADYFGASSAEAGLATTYFLGPDDSTVKPGAMLFSQYNLAAVAAYLRGGDISTMMLAELQALHGTLSIVIDGVLKTATVNLAAATSFSNAASIAGFALGIRGPQAASVVGSIAGTTLTVASVVSGELAVGDVLSATGGGGIAAGTFISGLGTGSGGAGTYAVSQSQTVTTAAITAYAPGVAYDSVSGAFVVSSSTTGDASTLAYGSGAMATSLLLTSITGAVLSQGADAQGDPEAYMDVLTTVTQNWAIFSTTFDPDGGSGNDAKLAFAAWTNGKNNRYAYVGWDTDASPTTSNPASSSLGQRIIAGDYSGTFVFYATDDDRGADLAAFILSAAASLDFTETNGRATFAFRKQSGQTATVTSQTAAENLIANGYNFYGAYATANDQFTFLYPGKVSGPFAWMDSYVNEIWLNNAFQLALMVMLTSVKSVPYNAAGRGLVEATLQDPINAALNFGAIRAGVTLSASQVAQVNADAGARISEVLSTRGWYLQVLNATAAVRAARGSPPCKFWYMDGGSVQKIDLASIELQ